MSLALCVLGVVCVGDALAIIAAGHKVRGCILFGVGLIGLMVGIWRRK